MVGQCPRARRVPGGTHTRSLAPAAQGHLHLCREGTSPRGGGGTLPHRASPREEPCCPPQERGQGEPLKGPGEGGNSPRWGETWPWPPALLCPHGLPRRPHGHGGAGRRRSRSPQRRRHWPRSLPCLGLTRSHPCESVSVAPVECLSVCPSVRLFVRGALSGPRQSPQPPINVLESSSSSGAGSQEGSGEGGDGPGPPRGAQRGQGWVPGTAGTGTGACPSTTTSLYKTNHIYCTVEHGLNVSDLRAPGTSASPVRPAQDKGGPPGPLPAPAQGVSRRQGAGGENKHSPTHAGARGAPPESDPDNPTAHPRDTRGPTALPAPAQTKQRKRILLDPKHEDKRPERSRGRPGAAVPSPRRGPRG